MTQTVPTCRLPLDRRPALLQVAVGRVPLPGPEWMRYDFAGYWGLHLYRYHGDVEIEGVRHLIRPGMVTLAPAGAKVAYRWRREPGEHVYALFRLPRKSRRAASVPRLFDLAGGFERAYASLSEAIGFFPVEPLRAEIRLWDVLWELAQRPDESTAQGSAHAAVREAQRYIELRLGRPIRVPEVARHVGLSHNHLIRLFRADVGGGIAAYIRRRRVQHARHLLTRSSLPIKAVAAEVGITDLQLFNKTIRRELGAAPRALREGRARG